MIRISPNAVGDAKIIKLAVRFGSAIKLYFQVGNDSLVEFLQCESDDKAKEIMNIIENIKEEKVGFNPSDKDARKE